MLLSYIRPAELEFYLIFLRKGGLSERERRHECAQTSSWKTLQAFVTVAATSDTAHCARRGARETFHARDQEGISNHMLYVIPHTLPSAISIDMVKKNLILTELFPVNYYENCDLQKLV